MRARRLAFDPGRRRRARRGSCRRESHHCPHPRLAGRDRDTLACAIRAGRYGPRPSRFCSLRRLCRRRHNAETPLEYVAIKQAVQNQIVSGSLLACMIMPGARGLPAAVGALRRERFCLQQPGRQTTPSGERGPKKIRGAPLPVATAALKLDQGPGKPEVRSRHDTHLLNPIPMSSLHFCSRFVHQTWIARRLVRQLYSVMRIDVPSEIGRRRAAVFQCRSPRECAVSLMRSARPHPWLPAAARKAVR
jgi:hypothetical protein